MRKSLASRAFDVFNYTFLALFALFCFLPFYMVTIASFTDERYLRVDGYMPWPKGFSVAAYRWVLRGQDVIDAYKISLFVTMVGTFLSLAFSCGIAYAMACRQFKHRSKISFYVYFTMIFSGGVIPWYIVCRAIGLYDNVWALILPMVMNPWWIFVLRNFFLSLPPEIMESARIDGASDLTILSHIVLPLSKPVLATTLLFTAVGYWNDWWHGMILLSFVRWRPLAVLIMRLITNLKAMYEAMQAPGVTIDFVEIPTMSVRMATVVITIGPILFLYPFVQKYFIRGLTIGAVKG